MSYNGAPVYDKMEYNNPNDTSHFSQSPINVECLNLAAYHWQRLRWFCYQAQHAIDLNTNHYKEDAIDEKITEATSGTPASPGEILGSRANLRQMIPQTPDDASFILASQKRQSQEDDVLKSTPQPDTKRDVTKPTETHSDSKFFKCEWCSKSFKGEYTQQSHLSSNWGKCFDMRCWGKLTLN